MIFAIIPILIIAGSVMLFSAGDIGKNFDLKYPALKLKLNLSASGSAGSPPSPLSAKAPPPSSSISPEPSPAPKVSQNNNSPFYSKVKISKITPATSSRPSLITLTTKIQGDETINITGWKFEARTDRYIIPKGVEKFARFDVSTMQRNDIILQAGDKVLISSAFNPLANNVNFKPNQCFGYFSKDARFPLAVARSCPNEKPSLREISFLPPACQDFILKKIGRCDIPDYSRNTKVISRFDCYVYLKDLEVRFTYEYCFAQHSQDKNFFAHEWHIYTDGEEFLRAGHDRVVLSDQNNQFVSEYVY